VAPATAGTYNIRLFVNDGYSKIATSDTITVATGPTLAINDVSVTEGNSGTVNATFTVTLSPVNASQTVTVDFATANGSATTANNDYTAASGMLTFAPSMSTQTITVPVVGDMVVENNETFVINLSNAVNAALGDAQAIATIATDDIPSGPAVTLDSLNVAAGSTVNFTVSNGPGNSSDWVGLYAESAGDVSGYLHWRYLNGTNTPPSPGLSNATLQLPAPTAPGRYHIRFFANNGYGRLATSATFTVP
jgi:hypothetical protein